MENQKAIRDWGEIDEDERKKKKKDRANDSSLTRGLYVATFPPKRNLKVGKHRALLQLPSAVNETSSARSHFQFSTA